MTNSCEDAEGQQKIEIYMIEFAKARYQYHLPPFIDSGLPANLKPGMNQKVLLSTDSGHSPPLNGSTSVLICQTWGNTDHRFWTLDLRGYRYIVKGFPASYHDTSWVVYRIWDGEDRGSEDKLGFRDRVVACEYRPEIVPMDVSPESNFPDRSSRRQGPGKLKLIEIDRKRRFFKLIAMTEKAEKSMDRNSNKTKVLHCKGQ